MTKQWLQLQQETLKLTASLKKQQAEQAFSPTPVIVRGGPQTDEGKALVRFNALKHGMTSKVIAAHEREDYLRHCQQIRDTYQPVGFLEEKLAERIANSLWRLGRVEAYEAAIVANDSAKAMIEVRGKPSLTGEGLEDLQYKYQSMLDAVQLHKQGTDFVAQLPAERLFDWVWGFWHTAELSSKGFSRAERQLKHGLKAKGYIGEWTEANEHWTFELACQAVTGFVGSAFQMYGTRIGPILEAWEEYQEHLEKCLQASAGKIEHLERLQNQALALAGMSYTQMLDKIAKYEAHIERTLYRAMHELEALQDKRKGNPAPLGRLELHGTH